MSDDAPQTIADARFSQTLTLADAYRVMDHFLSAFASRGDMPVSEALWMFGICSDGVTTSDPAMPSDFLRAWQQVQADRPSA